MQATFLRRFVAFIHSIVLLVDPGCIRLTRVCLKARLRRRGRYQRMRLYCVTVNTAMTLTTSIRLHVVGTVVRGQYAPLIRRLRGLLYADNVSSLFFTFGFCRDLDDALSCTALPNGNFEVGVHIADVSFEWIMCGLEAFQLHSSHFRHFLKPDTALDKIARRRATTTYLVQRCYSMLPRILSEQLCRYVGMHD